MALTPKQELFVREWVKTGDRNKAYRTAYNSKGKDKTVYDESYRLSLNPDVSQKYNELKAEAEQAVVEKIVFDRTHLSHIAYEQMMKAIADGDQTSAHKYLQLLGGWHDVSAEKQNDRQHHMTEREQKALLEHFKKRMIDVTPETEE